jgi:hypothetical protein
VVVVDDLVAHVDRRAELRERTLHDLDRASTPAQKPRGCASSTCAGDTDLGHSQHSMRTSKDRCPARDG